MLTNVQQNTIHYVRSLAQRFPVVDQRQEIVDDRILAHAYVRMGEQPEHPFHLGGQVYICSNFLFAIADQLFRWRHCPGILGMILNEPVFTQFVAGMYESTFRVRRQRRTERSFEKRGHVRTSFSNAGRVPLSKRADNLELALETVQTIMFRACNHACLLAPVSIRSCQFVPIGGVRVDTCWEVLDASGQSYKCGLSTETAEYLAELCSANTDCRPDELTYINVTTSEVWEELDSRGNVVKHTTPVVMIKSARRPSEGREPLYNTLIGATLMTVFNLARLERSQSTIAGVDDRENTWNDRAYHDENTRILNSIESWVNERFGTFRQTLFAIERELAYCETAERRMEFAERMHTDIGRTSYFEERQRLFTRIRENVRSFMD